MNFPSEILFGKPPDKVSFFKPNQSNDPLRGPSEKRNSEDVSPTRVGPEHTRGRGSLQGSSTREEQGESSRHGARGSVISADDTNGMSELPITRTEERVNSFIKAPQYKNVRMASAEEFPFRPQGTYRYRPADAPATSSAQFQEPHSPTIAVEANSLRSERDQYKHISSQQTGTAYEILLRIRALGARRSAPRGPQTAPGPSESPASESVISRPCLSGSGDQTILTAVSQSTTMDKGRGRASSVHDCNTKNGSSDNNISASRCKAPLEGDSVKMNKGKAKTVRFSIFSPESEIAAAARRGISGPAGPSLTSTAFGSRTAVVDDYQVQHDDSFPNVLGARNSLTASTEQGKHDGGEADTNSTNTSIST